MKTKTKKLSTFDFRLSTMVCALALSFSAMAQTPPAPDADNIDYNGTRVVLRYKDDGWKPTRIGIGTSTKFDRTGCIDAEIDPVYISATFAISTAELTAGAFPAGVSGVLAGNIYTISGKPTASGTFNYTVTVAGAAGKSGSVSGKITVEEGEGCVPPVSPETLPDGTGILSGKVCFDIAATTCDGIDPSDEGRTAQKTDFSIRTPQNPGDAPLAGGYSGVQTYTFKATSANVSNVRYQIDDPEGVIETISPTSDVLVAGSLTNGDVTSLTISYKSNLNQSGVTPLIVGRDRNDAAKVSLYIIYYNGSTDVKVKMDITVQDCSCGCSLKKNATEWLTFMCYNLGARSDMSIAAQVAHTSLRYSSFASSSTYATDAANVHGDLYQWGRNKEDGHHVRSSQSYPNNNSSSESGVIGAANLDENGQVTLAGAIGKFIKNNASATSYDWRTPQLPTLWDGNSGSGTTRIKTANDPCPQGWRVPTQAEWASVADENFNDRTRIGTFNDSGSATGTPGWLFKPRNGAATAVTTANATLFLPAAGCRVYNNSAFSGVGSTGDYWSSTVDSTLAYAFFFHDSIVSASNNYLRAYGFSVRCVAE